MILTSVLGSVDGLGSEDGSGSTHRSGQHEAEEQNHPAMLGAKTTTPHCTLSLERDLYLVPGKLWSS